MNIKFPNFLIGMALLLISSAAFSAGIESLVEPEVKEAKVEKQATMQTLFLSKGTRDKIDKQRESYLNPVTEKKVAKILPKKSGQPKVKRIYIPPRVEISAVIVKPDGSTLIRVNDKYNHSPSKYIDMDYAGSSAYGVPVTIEGKTQIVPVGSTLLTRQNRLVKTYKLDSSARIQSAPKTKQVAVKERLEQVQILRPK